MSTPLTDRQRWRGFWVVISISAMTNLDLTKVVVALPSIERALGATSTDLQIIFAGYVLTFGLFLVPMGRLGDQRSRRVLFLIGLSLFMVGSILCALAPTTDVLLIGRLLQGMGAGTQMPQIVGVVQQYFQGDERARAFGLFGAVIGVSVAAGPVLGGVLIAAGGGENGWRLIFLMNVPLCIGAMAAIIWLLPSARTVSSVERGLDLVGVALFGAATIALMAPFLLTTGSPSDPPSRWFLLLVFAAFAGAFVMWELHYLRSGSVPLIQPGLFRIPSYRNGALVGSVYFAAYPTLFLLTGLYLQLGAGVGPLAAGAVNIGYAFASAAGSWFGGLLVMRTGRAIVTSGLAIVLVGVVGMMLTVALLPSGAVLPVMAAVMTVTGIGGGLVVSPNQTLALADIPVKDGGLAGSIGQLGQRVGTAIGSAAALAVFYSIARRADGRVAPASSVVHAYVGSMAVVALILVAAIALSWGGMRRDRRVP